MSKPRNTEIHENTNPGTLLEPSQNPDGWCTVSVKQISMTILHNWQVQFSRSVVSDSLWPHGLQHTSPSCPSPTPGVHPNPCPLSRWCHSTISASVIPFSSCFQSFPASGCFQMSQFFTSGGQSIAEKLPLCEQFSVLWVAFKAPTS